MFSDQSPSLDLPSLAGAGDKTRAIVSTLLYYDLFDFAPSAAELVHFAHRGGVDGHFDNAELTAESDWWSSRDGYWFLRGREHIVSRRDELARASRRKLDQARRWARRLQVIPGVRFIGVTGSLSMSSAVIDDDIDMLIIAAHGRLWLTRALVLGALWGGGVKRADDGRPAHPDEICANIFISEDDLHIPDHNLFIAHEIGQMLPLLGPATYARFIQVNQWICDYLPQWQPPATQWQDGRAEKALQRGGEILLSGPIGGRLETEMARRQLARIHVKHARGHNVGIKLSQTQLRFHPRDLSQYVLGIYQARWDTLCADGNEP